MVLFMVFARSRGRKWERADPGNDSNDYHDDNNNDDNDNNNKKKTTTTTTSKPLSSS